jgi:16S rRNA (cytidine1402-2'-O)-methyltransferase
MIDSLLAVCDNNTLLCIASDITLPTESVITKSISEWKKKIPDLNRKLVVFVMQ